ncbi:hypothetical protein [Parasphingorhabdus cellanae]|uniref:Terminase small subunit n=1 Tax=Parasphingorhabdus cellanae TaxID=2806553 RepID=A0ABX7T019_9SPHN|nr:hypothetical protein [Parasphingorhabdus cellanae]QTD54886.1 hypothetical protein J4G78_11585 [Parasphingorhabdus cellanae]
MTDHPTYEQFTDIPAADDLAQPKERHDGWSPDRQVVFLEALARTGNVKAAAAYTGLSRESAYKLRRRPDGRAFARAWDAALIHARDIYQDALLDKGLNGWNEAVWHQGEEVGMRTRWSAPLFLAAMARLDKMADGLDVAGKPARVAAEHFDDLLDGIGKGEDCAALVDKIEASGRMASAPSDARSNSDLLAAITLHSERETIQAMAPEDIDVSDLDVADCEDWDDLQWERAERSGYLERSGFYEQEEGEDAEKQEPVRIV